METFTNFKKQLFIFIALMGMNTNVWAGAGDIKFTATVYSQPANGGYVTVKNSTGSYSYTTTSESSSQTKTSSFNWGYKETSATFYYYANAKTGYSFKGWSTSSSATSGDTSNPMTKTYTGKGNVLGNATSDAPAYYAIFTANKYTVTFDPNGDEVSAGSVTPTSKEVTFASAYGTLPTPTRRFYDFVGWFTEDGTEVTTSSVVSTASNHTLYAHWTLHPEDQTISWGEGMQFNMAKGTLQPIVVSSTSGLTEFSYESDNEAVIAIEGEYLKAIAPGTAKITVRQAGNTYFNSAVLETNFSVWSKETPVFAENGFVEGENDLKVDDVVSINLTNVSDGLNGDFTVTATTEDVMGIVRDGNVLTFTALHAGSTTITVSQSENEDIFAASKTYTFYVTRYQPQFSLDKNELELEQTATLSLAHVDGVNISFAPEGIVSYDGSTGIITAVAPGTTTMTVSQAQTNSIDAREETYEIVVSKKTPTLTVLMNNTARTSMSVGRGASVTVAFEKVSDAEVVVTNVSGSQYASYVDGVMTSGAEGKAVYRATLAETDTYQAKSVDFSLTVTANNNHLPISITSESTFNNLKSGSSGDYSWKGNEGFCVGGYNGWLEGVSNWDDKYVTFKFEGVPNELSFQYKFIYRDNGLNKMTATAPGGSTVAGQLYFIYAEESADGQNWSAIMNDQNIDKDNWKSFNKALKKSTRYIRFHLHANYGALFRNISVSELSYMEEPDPKTIDFGSAVINSGEVSKTSQINWCNIAPLSVTSSNPRFSVSPSLFGNFDQYATQTLTIGYTHTNEAGVNEGDITISNGLQTQTIHVTATTTKRPQVLTWNAELAATGYAMNIGEQYPDSVVMVLASATSGERITYTSDNSEIIEVIADTALLAKAVGTAQITAHQAGDAEYEEVSNTQTFQVTNKQKQTIIWEQNLYGLLTTTVPLELTATATSGGEITYTSADENIVKVEGNVLTVVGEGETYITATQAGGIDANEVEWLAVSQNNYVIVRDPASQCKGMALSQGSFTLNNNSRTFNLSGIPQTLTFAAQHGKKTALWGTAPSYAPLLVEQFAFINNQWDWFEVYNNVVGTESDTQSGDIVLDESATKVRFSTIESGTNHTINNIQVSRKKFMRADVTLVDQEAETNSEWKQTITVAHSNIDVMTVTSKQGLLTLSSATLGDGCEDFTEDAFTVSFTPKMKNQEFKDTIVITDGKEQPSTIEIPVRLVTKGLNQSINDFDLPAEALATDEIAVATTASSGLEVAFLSSDSAVAYVEEGRLAIVSAGTVTITATQEGDAKYDAAQPIAKTIVITKVPTTITTAPTAATIVYGQSLEASALSEGEGSVAGTFAWETPQAVPAAGTPSYNVVFTPTQSGIYATSTTLVSLRVEKATPVVTAWPTATEITIAQSVGDAELQNGEANVEGSFAWKNPTENRLKPGTYERTVVFTPADANYNTVESTVNVTVINVLARIVELPTIVSKNLVYGVKLAEVAMQGGSANVEGAFSWKDSTTLLLSGTKAYEAVFTPADLELYSPVNVEIEVTVAKAAPVVTTLPVAGGLVYGQLLKESQLTDYEVSVPGAYVWQNGEELLNAGEYQRAIVFLPTDTNYSTVPAELTVTVTKANASAVAPAAIENLVYNGEAQTLIAAGEAQGGELQYSLDGENWSAELPQAVNAGAYAIYYKVVADDNHNDYAAEAPVAAEIAKASASVTAPVAIENLVYTGEAQTLITAGEAQGGELQYSLDGENWNTELPTAVEGGKYTVSYRVAGDANHDSIDAASLYVTIDYTIAYELAGGIVETENPTHYNAETETFTLNNPTKEHYTFAGWTGSNGEEPQTEVTIEQGATGNRTYTANWTINKYQITWLNADSSLIDETEVEYGAMPEHADAEKAATAQYTYTFKGWTPALAEVTGVATYKAEFDSVVNVYTVIFKNGEEVLQKTQLAYGETPVYEGENPTKAADAQYTYTFNGWDKEIVAVTGEATYTAEYDSTLNKYQITFMNGEDVLQSTEVEYGATPVYTGETPVKAADAQNTYAFAGWDAEIVAVTGNATYTATFNSTVNKYTITWLNADDSLIDETEVEYGAMPEHADAEKAATAQYTYTFKGWTPALAEVTGVATYKAEFDSVVNVYTVIFKNGEEVLQKTQLAYGETPVYEGENPTKAADAQYTYTFNGWDKEIVAVTGEATYTAEYDSTLNKYLITFMNGEDVLQSTEVEYGAMPAYNGEAPTKEATAQFSYTFKGWTPALAEVTGEATYTAEFDSLAVVPEKQFQMIVWEQEFSTIEVGDATLQLNAEAGSWLDVYYTSSDSTIAYVNEQNYVVALKAGEVTITAHQDGNETYLAAEPVSKTLTVTNNGQQGGGHDATAVDDAQGNSVQCTKVLRGNQVLIIRDGKTYNLRGQRVD